MTTSDAVEITDAFEAKTDGYVGMDNSSPPRMFWLPEAPNPGDNRPDVQLSRCFQGVSSKSPFTALRCRFVPPTCSARLIFIIHTRRNRLNQFYAVRVWCRNPTVSAAIVSAHPLFIWWRCKGPYPVEFC